MPLWVWIVLGLVLVVFVVVAIKGYPQDGAF